MSRSASSLNKSMALLVFALVIVASLEWLRQDPRVDSVLLHSGIHCKVLVHARFAQNSFGAAQYSSTVGD
jgi:hypothetical protein